SQRRAWGGAFAVLIVLHVLADGPAQVRLALARGDLGRKAGSVQGVAGAGEGWLRRRRREQGPGVAGFGEPASLPRLAQAFFRITKPRVFLRRQQPGEIGAQLRMFGPGADGSAKSDDRFFDFALARQEQGEIAVILRIRDGDAERMAKG